MATDKRQINEPRDLARLITAMKEREYPFLVAIRDGKDRTGQQNRLVHQWFTDIANWNGDTSMLEVKAECNLVYGRPIMARDDPDWDAAFGYIFDALSRPAKLKAIRVLDIPFTRNMGVKQLTEYMDQMQRDYREAGVPLTDPAMQGYE